MGEGRRASEGGQRVRKGDEGGNDQEDISNEKRNERRQTLPLLERVVRERTESTLAHISNHTESSPTTATPDTMKESEHTW